ncbi:MAG TPA: Mur ligase family protein [Thermomicrobiales bacterium]|nr:Mur ligase family protein [Thermomicrobiales bacterium]
MTDTSPRVESRSGRERLRAVPTGLPIISIAGSRGKSTVAWMLHEVLHEARWPSASWLSSGVYVDGQLQEGELGPWSKVVLAARYGELDVVIQELNAATVIGAGLPKNTYPIEILTTLCGNHEACLLSADTVRERKALEIAVDAVHPDGIVIANADDYDVVELTESSVAESVFYALHRENPTIQRQLAAGAVATWLADGWITHGDDRQTRSIMPIAEIQGTLDGEILFQAQNALAAASAALVLGIDDEMVRRSLARFEPRPDRQPAACNIVRFNEATILVDSPRYVNSLKLLARGVRHTPHRRTLVVSGCFPGLSVDECVEAGRIVGGLGGIILLHGEHAPDGRMEAIRVGLSTAAVPPIVLSMPDEGRAIDQLLNTVAPGDLALVLADDAETALARLWPAPSIAADRLRSNGM